MVGGLGRPHLESSKTQQAEGGDENPGRRSRGRWRSEAVGGALDHFQVFDFNHLESVCGGEVLLSTANSPN